MKTLIEVLLVILIVNISVNASTYYVKTDGNNSNNGLSEATAWKTITYAATQAISPGDIVYVKAGTYDKEIVEISSGISGNPIIFEGYKNTPGDITNTNWWSYPDALDASEMPLLDGHDRENNVALSLSSYSILKNFQVANYAVGIFLYDNSTSIVENIIGKTFGTLGTTSGNGINVTNGDGNEVKNCSIVNSAGEGISLIYSTNNTIDSCKVYCDELSDGTDYYIVITSNDGSSGSNPFCNNNTIKNCYIERATGVDHGGAGIGMKGTCENNTIENCTAKNLKNAAFYVRHSGAKNNEIKNCTAIGGDEGDGFIVRDGAKDNTFTNCKADGCVVAVGFYFSGEDAGATTNGENNKFYNCIFSKTKSDQVSLGSSSSAKDTRDNSFINCVFEDGDYLFDAVQSSTGNSIINSIIVNVTNYKSASASVGFSYTNSNFYNNSFATPSGTNILSSDPKFTDVANNNFHLLGTSPCIDAGTADTTGLSLPSADADGNVRVVGGNSDASSIIDMGVYEFGSPPVPVELIMFTAKTENGKTTLNWKTATEVNNYGFEIETSTRFATSGFIKIGFVAGHGNSNTPQNYSFIATDEAKYYRLKQVDTDGLFEYSDVVEVKANLTYKLSQNYPNPFNPTSTINFTIPSSQNVELSVYNMLGEKVAELLSETMSAGDHSVSFDASNLSSGIYFYRLQVESFVSSKKMVLLK